MCHNIAPLTPLLKTDNGIRPIAVDIIWRLLVFKVAMKGVGKEMSKYLSDFQFGVGVSGGAEVVLHSVNRVLSEYHSDGSLAMLTVDFSNAFNLVDRSALLHEVRLRSKTVASFFFILDILMMGLLLEIQKRLPSEVFKDVMKHETHFIPNLMDEGFECVGNGHKCVLEKVEWMTVGQSIRIDQVGAKSTISPSETSWWKEGFNLHVIGKWKRLVSDLFKCGKRWWINTSWRQVFKCV
ncbi:hypothetical protein Tco_0978414 [Tanacetum coccineum]|uniref:Reverse transcriptase domain-containing protein n=1 Tax=Tanacetum coccineum TaxID=301880 RepID=A0ABQ5EP01_9ASTR